jgi:hypothetical protein
MFSHEVFMYRKLAITFGLVFLLVGTLGFVPGVTQGEHLLGIFHVNAAHNVVHLLTGFVALAVGFASAQASQLFFRIFGAIYGLVALLGFAGGDRAILGIIANNRADSWLHLAIAAVSFLIGFVLHETPALREQNV